MTSVQQGPDFDPFEQGEGVKAVSFKNAPQGSVISIEIDDDSKWLQSRNFDTQELDYWPARPGETPNPKMAAVVTGKVLETPWAQQSGQAGERRSVWAGKPSNLFTAIQNAKRAAGGGTALPILKGGRLDIAFVGEEPNREKPHLANIKLYQAQYTPPPAGFGVQDAFEGNQAFAGQQPQAAPVQQQYAQGGYVQQPQAPVQQPFQQQAPVAQQPVAPGQAVFGQQAPVQQQPQGQPFGQQAPVQQQPQPGQFGGGQPAGPFGQQPQQPAMSGAPAAQDPWATAPSSDVPPF